MGFFSRLFGPRQRKAPGWSGFDDAARFDDFVSEVCSVLDEHKHSDVIAEAVWSGSVVLGEREWILHQVAQTCAAQPPDTWRAAIEADFRGGVVVSDAGDDDGDDDDDDYVADDDAAAAAPASSGGRATGKAWVMGTTAWGGVLLEAGGTKQCALVLLPLNDAARLAEVRVTGLDLAAIVVCNTGDGGVLDASAIATRAGVKRVYTLSPVQPADRGVTPAATPVESEMLTVLRLGPLCLTPSAGGVRAVWDNGTTALVGDALSFADIYSGRAEAHYVFGRVDLSDREDGVDALAQLRRLTIMATVGAEALDEVKVFGELGVHVEVAHKAKGGAGSARDEVLALAIAGDLDAADAKAAAAIAAGKDVGGMRHQRGLIALMRGDEDAAIAALEQATDVPEATHSLAAIYARRGDARARALSRQALAALPGDVLAIQGAVLAHAATGDADGARALLAEHGHHLEDGERAVLARALEGPAPQIGAHRFPEHARAALAAAALMVDQGKAAPAEKLLRRAVALDGSDAAIVAELGALLSQLGRDKEAIGVYDTALARGGPLVELVRFNRANCLIRKHRFGDAIKELRRCLEILPSWNEARVNLIAALFADGKRADAQRTLDELRRLGGAREHIAALEDMFARVR